MIISFIVTLLVFAVIDATWIGFIVLPMFKATLGQDLLTFRLVPGVLFYLVQTAGILIFVYPLGQPGGWRMQLLYGGLFGLFTYCTYDLTNYATLKPWTLSLAAADIAWGTVLTGFTAMASSWIVARITG